MSEIIKILSLNPKPQYQDDPERVYGMRYEDYDIRFMIKKNRLFIIDIDFIHE